MEKSEVEDMLQGEEFERLEELVALGSIVVPHLIEILGNHPEMFMRARASIALGEIGDDRAVGALTEALSAEASLQRSTAARALANISGAGATDALVALLDDPAMTVSRVALECLAEVGSREAIASINRIKDETSEDFLRTLASTAIDNIEKRNA